MSTINKEMNLELVLTSRQTELLHDGMEGYQDFSIELDKIVKALKEKAIKKTMVTNREDCSRYNQYEVYVLEFEDFYLHVTEFFNSPYGIDVARTKNYPEEL